MLAWLLVTLVLPGTAGADRGLTAPKVEDLDQGEHAPRQRITLVLSGRKVVVEYGRPALRGRTIAELVATLPSSRIWRMGANDVTTLTTDGTILIGGKRVPAGAYTLYAHVPEGGPWSLLVNSDRGVALDTLMPGHHPELGNPMYPRADTYSEIAGKEVARIPLRRLPPSASPEFFEIALAPADQGAWSITLRWGKESWTTTLRADR